MKMLSGFRSRWMMPSRCAALSALATLRAMNTASRSGSRPCSPSRCASEEPSSSSIAMYEVPSGVVAQS